MILEEWIVKLDLSDSTQTPDVETLAALDSLLAYGPEYLDLCQQRAQTLARLVAAAKAHAHNGRN